MSNHSFSKKIVRFPVSFCLAAAVALLAGCGGGGSGTTTDTGPVASTLSLLATPPTVNSDGSSTTQISVVALNAANAAVSGVVATLSADVGILGEPTVVTVTGDTPAYVTFAPGSSKINRTATITATAGTASAQIPVQITGSTVSVNASGATLPDDGQSPVTLTIAAKDSGGNAVSNAAVTLTQTGTGSVTLTPSSGATDANGELAVVAKGTSAGKATVKASALGATATTELTVSPTAATFAIDQVNGADALNTAMTSMKIGETLTVRVNSLSAANVTFATTMGTWNGGTSSVLTVPASGGKASASLTTSKAGVATVQVYDAANHSSSDTLAVAMSSNVTASASITVQPSPSVVSRSVGTTKGSSTLIAMVRDANGFPVGDAPVSFSIVNPTGGGEAVSPVVVLTASTTTGGLGLGEARTSFTSGSSSSGAGGVQVRASVVGTTVETEPFDPVTMKPINLTSSGNDATIIIGGTSGSVAFGQATAIATDTTNSNYILDMSVMVTDSNGNPVPEGTVVNLSAWPIAFSTGTYCTPDADSPATPYIPGTPATTGSPAVAAVAAVAARGTSGVSGDLTVTANASMGATINDYRITIQVNDSLNALATVTSSSWSGITVQVDTDGSHDSTWTQVASALNVDSTFISRTLLATTANGGQTVVAADAQVIVLSGGVTAVAAQEAIPAEPEIPGTLAQPARGTFYNEDVNENLILDAGEDGVRQFYADETFMVGGTVNGYVTPPSSAAGSVPASVQTDENGAAGFQLIYPKKSAIWIVDRIRGRTVVQGTEMVGEITFRLQATQPDVIPICKLPDSDYKF